MSRDNRLIVVYMLAVLMINSAICRTSMYSNTWVAQVEGGQEEAQKIAREKDLILLGQVGSLEGFYMFKHLTHPRRSRRSAQDITTDLSDHPNVIWADQQIVKHRVKRYKPIVNDPDFSKQWFIQNRDAVFMGYDHNILPVWEQGITGKNVVVSILDDGIEYTHKDLKTNYEPKASYDFNGNDADPAPRPTWNDENRHGTRCAGEVASVANNSICGVGVAPGAKVGGIRMLDGDVTDSVEGASLSYNRQEIDIYSSSWGPDDDGRTVDGPAKLAKKAFADGIKKGRGGLGSIFVWASGNGGRAQDSCSCDGYTNSIYTLSISSATEHGTSPWYSEYCASTLATTFSSGGFGMRKIVTTDLHGRCTDSHTGTSASAPLAAGILALAMEVNHNVTWRDMQHLVVRTSSNAKLESDDFVINAVGRKVSHKFGYGLLDAAALVDLARRWKTVPTQHVCREIPEVQKRSIPGTGSLKVTVETTGCSDNTKKVRYLEHVQVVLTLLCSRRGDLSIKLISPSGTPAILLPPRKNDYSSSGFTDWEFMSTHTWGEDPRGIWTLEIKNHGSSFNTGTLKNWYLVMYGTWEHASDDDSTKEPVPACNVECQNGCTGPQADQCKECKHFRRALDNECVLQCTKSEYEDPVGKLCKSCSLTCATCNGPSSEDCTSCHLPLILQNGSCVNFCPDGLYRHEEDSKAVCLKCNEPCLTCAGSATACVSCTPAFTHLPGKCLAKCQEGRYVAADGQCKPCHPSCSSCNAGTASSCTKCGVKDGNQILYLHSGGCEASCPLGFFGHAQTQECHPCDATCSGCIGPSTLECTSCNQGLYQLGSPIGKCITHCPKGHYPEFSNRTCLPCQSLCDQCDHTYPTKCTSCPPNLYLQMHQCTSADQCPEGTYANSTTRTCENCANGCTACKNSSGEQHCLACAEGFHMYKSQCLLRCPDGTFINDSASCVPCNAACQTCYGDGDDQCLTCALPKILSGSWCVTNCTLGLFHNQVTHRCEQCNPTCDSCSGPSGNECQSCKTGWNLTGSTCISSCPSGMVKSGSKCKKCQSLCLTCKGPTEKDCLSCSGIKFLDPVTSTCSYECPEGFYGDLTTTQCKPCSSGCLKCKNSAECIACMKSLHLVGNSCQTQCPQGFYLTKSNSCEPCDGTCEECISSPDHCVRCQAPNVLSNTKCVSSCPVGTYTTKNTKGCLPCHSSCKTCQGPTAYDCTGCHASAVMADSRCVSSCPQDYFFDKEANRCQQCDYYCANCEGGNGLQNCTKCVPPFVLYDHYCTRECPKHGWVLDRKLQKCIRCHSSCARCIGPSDIDCIACAEADKILVGFACKERCPSGSFPNHVMGVCEICHPSCETCSGPGAHDCQTCAKDLVRSQSTGMCSSLCPQGLFSMKGECQKCHPNCKTCNGPGTSNCLSCHEEMFFYNDTCVSSCPAGTYTVNDDGIHWCHQCHPVCQSCTGPSMDSCSKCRTPLLLEGTMCVVQCSPNYSIHENTRSCHPCGNNCKLLTRNKNRSVQNPSERALQFILQDPPKNSMSVVAISAAFVSVFIFLVIFGILHWQMKRRLKNTIFKALLIRPEDENGEDRVSLIDNEEDKA